MSMSDWSKRRKVEFEHVWEFFIKSTPQTYSKISFDVVRTFHGPRFPDSAFESVQALRAWYRTLMRRWLSDVFIPGDFWRGKLPSNDHELALCTMLIETKNCGVRRIHRHVFRDGDDIPSDVPIENYSDLSIWCDFIFEILNDDERWVDAKRQRLTIRYDKGVKYRLDEEHKESLKKNDPWVAAMTDKFMRAVSKAKPLEVVPDDEWLLVVWSGLADRSQPLREATVGLFIDSEEVPKQINVKLLEDMVARTWAAMRRLGPVCSGEPDVAIPKQVRNALDAVKLWCAKQISSERRRRKANNRSRSRLKSAKKQKTSGVEAESYDAFFAHNSTDKRSVLRIAEAMSKRGIKTWVDVEQIPPGRWFQEIIQAAIPRCRAAVVFIGPRGLGRWQDVELRALLQRCVDHGMPVIPVLLPRARAVPPELIFLGQLNWVKFPRRINDPKALDALFWGISSTREKS